MELILPFCNCPCMSISHSYLICPINSSVLSGELPPAMGKTALFYHSGGSSGYESMLRDSSENTGSNSSAQDSVSEHSSATTSSRRSSKTSKKSRSSTGQKNLTERIAAERFWVRTPNVPTKTHKLYLLLNDLYLNFTQVAFDTSVKC